METYPIGLPHLSETCTYPEAIWSHELEDVVFLDTIACSARRVAVEFAAGALSEYLGEHRGCHSDIVQPICYQEDVLAFVLFYRGIRLPVHV